MAKKFPFWRLKSPGYQCPSGEFIDDGSFELGAPEWTFNANAQITTAKARTGTHSVYFPNAPYGSENWIEQEFTPIREDCIDTFMLYWWKVSGGLGFVYFIFTVYYTNGTTRQGYFSSWTDPADWLPQTLLPNEPSKKFVYKVRILGYYVNGSAYVDDVTLIGSGQIV